MWTELNIDALVGPSHHYGGLGVGNVASLEHVRQPSSPRKAALEGLQKASLVASLGVPQFLWLPPVRPQPAWLQRLGFGGTLPEQWVAAYEQCPLALSAAFSSAFMWAANAATVTPACDAMDQQYHFTPANLVSSWHRAPEAEERRTDLLRTFARMPRLVVHDSLPAIVPLRDEGAANHMRLCDPTGARGFNVFVYGADEVKPTQTSFFPRHTRAASEAIARRHCLRPGCTFFLHQHPDAISAGAFHNDVIATSHRGLLIQHERAFLDAERELSRLESEFYKAVGDPLCRVVVSDKELSLADAVQSYFFNSQIVSPVSGSQDGNPGTHPRGPGDSGTWGIPGSSHPREGDLPRMAIICPKQCETMPAARKLVDRLVNDADNPIEAAYFVSLAESMAGGGGPACLRLRVPVESQWLHCVDDALRVAPDILEPIRKIIEEDYPEQLGLQDFCEPDVVQRLIRASQKLRNVVKSA